jgi:hypothetical protein
MTLEEWEISKSHRQRDKSQSKRDYSEGVIEREVRRYKEPNDTRGREKQERTKSHRQRDHKSSDYVSGKEE